MSFYYLVLFFISLLFESGLAVFKVLMIAAQNVTNTKHAPVENSEMQ